MVVLPSAMVPNSRTIRAGCAGLNADWKPWLLRVPQMISIRKREGTFLQALKNSKPSNAVSYPATCKKKKKIKGKEEWNKESVWTSWEQKSTREMKLDSLQTKAQKWPSNSQQSACLLFFHSPTFTQTSESQSSQYKDHLNDMINGKTNIQMSWNTNRNAQSLVLDFSSLELLDWNGCYLDDDIWSWTFWFTPCINKHSHLNSTCTSTKHGGPRSQMKRCCCGSTYFSFD